MVFTESPVENAETLESRQRINDPGSPPLPPVERETIIRRILFSRHVRPAVKIFPVSAMIERLFTLSPVLFSARHLSLLSFVFLITSWPVSKATSLVNRLLLFCTLTCTTRRISDSGVTRYAIRSRSEESINSPNECKLPRSRGKGLARRERRHGQKSSRRGNTRLPRATTYIPREARRAKCK